MTRSLPFAVVAAGLCGFFAANLSCSNPTSGGALECEEEGATEGDRVCRNGYWVDRSKVPSVDGTGADGSDGVTFDVSDGGRDGVADGEEMDGVGGDADGGDAVVDVGDAGDAGDAGDGEDAADGGEVDGCIPAETGESCNGMDDDCDGEVDEGLSMLCAEQRGVCQGASVTCNSSSGEYPACDDQTFQDYSDDYESDETSCDGVDNDCDGTVDEGCSCEVGSTSTGVCSEGTIAEDGSCQPPSNYENEETTCDGEDNDCDGTVDEGCPCDYNSTSTGVCSEGTIGGNGDCQPPSNYEDDETLCDGKDNDCDGEVDEGGATTFYADDDGDGFGDPNDSIERCQATAPDGYVKNADDCDDGSAFTYPGAAEEESSTACRKDADQDGYGDANPPQGVDPGGDCDDSNEFAYPGAAEDEDPSACMEDRDQDGWGDVNPPGGVDAGTDCRDDLEFAYPGAAEDDSGTACMLDADQDGYGDDDPPADVTAGADCDDAADYTYPGAAEQESQTACRKDQDQDGYGDDSPPAGVDPGGDCDDNDDTQNPGAQEVCNGEDDDCDGQVDEGLSGSKAAGETCSSACECLSGYCDSNGSCAHRVFATSAETDGDFDPDTFCANNSGGLQGNWKAIISTDADSASARIDKKAAVVNTCGSVVVDSSTSLWSTTLSTAVTCDETGTEVQGPKEVWTGTNHDGSTAANLCAGNNGASWSSAAGPPTGTEGQGGELNRTDQRWLNSAQLRCDQPNHVYCIDGQ